MRALGPQTSRDFPIKALTIWQPWATLIMIGAKPWEWRCWEAPKWVIGQRIVIHAGARPVRPVEVYDLLEELTLGGTSLVVHSARALLLNTHRKSYPLAAGLGTAVLKQPIAALDWAVMHDKSGLDSDRINHSKWAWPLIEITPFPQPIPCRGAKGFWNWPMAGAEPGNIDAVTG